MVKDCTLHTMQGATARQLGFAWHVAMWWNDDQARYRSASRVVMNEAGGCVNQDLLLDDGTAEAVGRYAARYMMKTGRRRGGRIESTEK